MKTELLRLMMTGILTGTLVSSGSAQLSSEKGKILAGKIYLAETKGESQVRNGDKIYPARQATSFDAPGTVIETKAESHNAFVYSNGTGLYMDQNTRLEINRFTQEPFVAASNRLNPDLEPSKSQSNILVTKGAVGICTNQLVLGTTMSYETSLAVINIRAGRISIETKPDETIVDLLEGDIVVRVAGNTQSAQTLRPGERAVIRRGADGDRLTITINPIPAELMQPLDNRTAIACNSKKTVSFDVNDGAEPQIVPKPTVPANLPANITVSPDRLP